MGKAAPGVALPAVAAAGQQIHLQVDAAAAAAAAAANR
jgi:hypothetical protein